MKKIKIPFFIKFSLKMIVFLFVFFVLFNVLISVIAWYYPYSPKKVALCEKKEKVHQEIDFVNYCYYITDIKKKDQKIFAQAEFIQYSFNRMEPKTFLGLLKRAKLFIFLNYVYKKSFKEGFEALIMAIDENYKKKYDLSKIRNIFYNFTELTQQTFFRIETILDENKLFLGFKLTAKDGNSILYIKKGCPVIYKRKDGKIYRINNHGVFKFYVDCKKTITQKEMIKILKENNCHFPHTIDNFFKIKTKNARRK